jgi:hypothetical protein
MPGTCFIHMKIIQSKYEIYIENVTNHALHSVMMHWIWRKLNGAGLVTVHGSHHGSLEACFASVRKHRDAFGDAPISINLHHGQVKDAPKIVAVAVAGRDVSITSRWVH